MADELALVGDGLKAPGLCDRQLAGQLVEALLQGLDHRHQLRIDRAVGLSTAFCRPERSVAIAS